MSASDEYIARWSMFASTPAMLPVTFPKLMFAPMLRHIRPRPPAMIFGCCQIFHSMLPVVSFSLDMSKSICCCSTLPIFLRMLKAIVAMMTEMMTVLARSPVMNHTASAETIETPPESFSDSKRSTER